MVDQTGLVADVTIDKNNNVNITMDVYFQNGLDVKETNGEIKNMYQFDAQEFDIAKQNVIESVSDMWSGKKGEFNVTLTINEIDKSTMEQYQQD